MMNLTGLVDLMWIVALAACMTAYGVLLYKVVVGGISDDSVLWVCLAAVVVLFVATIVVVLF